MIHADPLLSPLSVAPVKIGKSTGLKSPIPEAITDQSVVMADPKLPASPLPREVVMNEAWQGIHPGMALWIAAFARKEADPINSSSKEESV